MTNLKLLWTYKKLVDIFLSSCKIKFIMREDIDENLTVFGDTQNSLITGPKLLLLTMVVLALQDLNLEKYFKGLKKYFVVSKKEKRDPSNMVSAFEYLFGADMDDPMSFDNFCFVFKIDPEAMRTLILNYIKQDKGMAWTEYILWREESGI